ncbi:MAG: Hsp20/alpha crystallin family protein [Calditrichaeota bacterium]|nr:MAG: Hsp20/alpha crystallin family protein [Calditrichota bacterium]
MALVPWTPMRELQNIQEEMNRLMERFFGPSLVETTGELTFTGNWYPMVDVTETKDELIVTAELPGMKKEDIHISYRDGLLTIEGERKQEFEEKDVNFHRVERRYGRFSRTFQLPVPINENKINAVYKDGVLTIHLPKAEEAKAKEIPVKTS